MRRRWTGDDVGTLTPGARADLAVLDAPSHLHLAYRPGVPLVRETWVSGRRVSTIASSGPERDQWFHVEKR